VAQPANEVGEAVGQGGAGLSEIMHPVTLSLDRIDVNNKSHPDRTSSRAVCGGILMVGEGRSIHAFAAPGIAYADATRSALVAPRDPGGASDPVVVSRSVWCSISAFTSPPTSTMMVEIQIHVMNPTTAPSEPYVLL